MSTGVASGPTLAGDQALAIAQADAARAYGRVFAAIAATGRRAQGARALDLLIAATACAHGLPLYTRNGDDFKGLEGVITVITI